MSWCKQCLDDRELGCICNDCNKRYKVDVVVSDDLWIKICLGDNMLCGMCIMKRIESLNDFGAYRLVDIVKD